MCFYVGLVGSLVRNLASRLWRDVGDWLVLGKRRLLYRLTGGCIHGYDDVGPDDSVLSSSLLLQQSDLENGLESKSWFLNADRKTAQELVMAVGEGCFVIRKSVRYPLTLTVFHENRPFNIPIRKREDGKIAMGSRKHNERTFESVEELVNFYGREKLILFSGGEKAGNVLLSSVPSKNEIERKHRHTCRHIMVHVPQ